MLSQPVSEERDFEAWNEELSRKYDIDQFHNESSFAVSLLERQRVKWVVKLVDAQANDRILEIGCGMGNILERIPAGQLYGIDLSNYVLEKARNRLGDRAFLQKANAESLPFAEGYFSKVYCTEVLEHVLNPQRVVSEAARVLAPDGILVISVPNDHIIVAMKKWLKRLGLYRLFLQKRNGYQVPEFNEWHKHEISAQALRDMMRPSFNIDKVKSLPSRLFPLHHLARGTKKGA
jgi:ubiquinone/menaquinone biosynthesis C-methylase UbiE